MRNYQSVNVRVPPEVKQWLDQRAQANRRSVTGEVSWIILQAKAAEAKLAQPKGGVQ